MNQYKNFNDAFDKLSKQTSTLEALKTACKLFPTCVLQKFIIKHEELKDFFNEQLEIAKIPNDTKDKFKYVMLREHFKGTLNHCPTCGNATLRQYCSPKCNNSSELTKQRKSQSLFEHYGVTNPNKSKEIRDKIKQTNLEKYGFENAFQNKEVQEKQHKTLQEKYGVDNISQLAETQEKIRQTSLEKYGVQHFLSSKEVKDKRTETNLERYGVKIPTQNQEIYSKIRQTNLERYGVEVPTQCDEIKNKVRQTNLERYGYEHTLQVPEIREKGKKTNLEKYGVESYSQTDEFLSKVKETHKKNLGVDYPMQSQEIRDKSALTKLRRYGDPFYVNHEQAKITYFNKTGYDHQSKNPDVKAQKIQTSLKHYGTRSPMQNESVKEILRKVIQEKYGVDNVFQNEDIKDKISKVNYQKYGVANPMQNDEIRNKAYATNLERYGVEHIKQSHIEHLDQYNEEYIRENFIKDGKYEIYDVMEYFNVSYKNANIHKQVWGISEPNRVIVEQGSKAENDLFESLDVKHKIQRDRQLIKPLELDIVLPDYKLAIEYDGLYWHSEFMKEQYYHLNKTKECLEKGYQLFHIFEFEDIEIWKSIINNKLGLNKKIYARKCFLQEIDHTTAKVFCEQNHLQGYVNSSIRLGLYFENELVQVMTFGRPRFNKDYDYELLRLCSLKGVNVVGGASKLFKFFTKHYSGTVISYANLRYSNGSVYEKLGFNKIGMSEPSYIYANGAEILSRYECQKHKLKEFKNYSDNKSEHQIMNENGFYRVYDCGNLIYLYQR